MTEVRTTKGRMMRALFRFAAISAVLVFMLDNTMTGTSICDNTPGNLVTNCGFETGRLTGWTVTGNDSSTEYGYLYGVEGLDPFDGISPNSGDWQFFVADLDANATTLSQTIATDPGARYTISWYMAQDTTPPNGYTNEFLVSFDGVTLDTLDGIDAQPYTMYTETFSAVDPSSVLRFVIGNDTGETLLDDIVVTDAPSAAPEPSTWLLIIIAAGSLPLVRWIRRPGPK